MLNEICAEIRNYFTHEEDRHIGTWTISEGVITPPLDIPTDYIRIIGSRLNDGVYKVSEMELRDETFDGAIWFMSIPSDFLALVSDIKAWQEANGSASSVNMSPFQSESFGGYSYSKGTSGGSSSVPTWQSQYASRLNRFRRIREL